MNAKQDSSRSAQPQQGTQASQDGKANAIALLKADHRKVNALFRQAKSEGAAEKKVQLVRQICTELIVHTRLEEEIFYAACREADIEDDLLDEAQVEHDGAKVLIAELLQEQPDAQYYDAKVSVLSEYIKHHVGEEENPGSGIFAKARAAKLDMNALGQRLQSRKEELMQEIKDQGLRPPTLRALDVDPINRSNQEKSTMPRQYERDRDDQGRFASDDDDRRGGRGYYGRSSERGSNDRGSNERGRDDQGRFMSEDDDRSGGQRSYRGREDDDYRSSSRGGGYENRGSEGRSQGGNDYDDRYSSRGGSEGRNRGGWFGDSEGHSRASEEGWENRGRGGGSSSRSRDDDEDRYSSRGSSRGGSSGSGRGWFGDPEGHSRASEEGWENRGRAGGSSSRSRDEDDERDERGGGRGRSQGQGQGGWFGDPRGHSEASRRGWQNR
jgi:hypothetical protein